MSSTHIPTDGNRIDYDALLKRSLLDLVREILADAATNGLRGDHHFFVAFSTTYPDVVIPAFLREKHPTDMTIVLQNQFWDLQVGEESFSVKLNFNGKGEQLTIPFDALLGFLDPSVQFALPFRDRDQASDSADEPVESAREEPQAPAEPALGEDEEGNVIALDAFRKQ